MADSIKIISSSEEVRAWTRRITLTFNGKEAYVRLWYDEGNGYETTPPDFKGDWSDEETVAFYEYLRSDEGKEQLDELTSYINGDA